MKRSGSALVYTALALGAIAVGFFVMQRSPNSAPPAAAGFDVAAVEALREGSMAKLIFHAQPKPAGSAVMLDPEGGEHHLSDYAGQVALVNFWATWCAPCRKEMPSLDALQAQMGGEDFQVVPVALGRNEIPAIKRFFAEIKVENLPILLDKPQALGREMGVLGLPITVVLNREGNEIARLQGEADWDSESAKAIITALIGQ